MFTDISIANMVSAKADWKKSIPGTLIAATTLRKYKVHGHGRFDMIGPVGPICKEMERYGKHDNEKRACGLLSHVDSNCTIISLGSNNEWGFEEEIFKKTTCKVHSFDCTVSGDVEPPEAIRSRVTLHKVCVGNEDQVIGNRKFVSWDSLLALAGISTPPSFLKMDIEGFEWEILPTIIAHKSGHY